MEEWAVLESYASEVEGRVVESFLRAQGLEVQLLDTHMNAYAPSSRSLGQGMRLMVRPADLEHARELLLETQRASHLEIVGEHTPVKMGNPEKIIIVILAMLVVIVLMVSLLKPK